MDVTKVNMMMVVMVVVVIMAMLTVMNMAIVLKTFGLALTLMRVDSWMSLR